MSDNYEGKTYPYFSDIPEEVIEDDELAIVDGGRENGYKVISAEQWEGDGATE